MSDISELGAGSVFVIPADNDGAVYVVSKVEGDFGPGGTASWYLEVLVCGEPDKLSVDEFEGEILEAYHATPPE